MKPLFLDDPARVDEKFFVLCKLVTDRLDRTLDRRLGHRNASSAERDPRLVFLDHFAE